MRPSAGRLLPLLTAVLLTAAAGCSPAILPVPSPDAESEPPTEALRAEAIRAAIAELQEECARHGGGSWSSWSAQDAYRNALRARIEATRPNNPDLADAVRGCRMIEARGPCPLFQPWPEGFLRHVLDVPCLETFARDRPVVTVSRWLKSQGIDLVFMPVPLMAEVYPERIASPCPDHRIIAPHCRKLVLDLLEHDVEVIDLLPVFLADPDRHTRPLYLPDDPHWAPRAKQVAARLVADRLRRYAFTRQPPGTPRHFETLERPYPYVGSHVAALTPAQQQRCAASQPRVLPQVYSVDEVEVVDQGAPVLFIGDSFNLDLTGYVASELGCSVAVCSGASQTVQAVVAGTQDPTIFRGRRVVVWIVNAAALGVEGSWKLPAQLASFRPRSESPAAKCVPGTLMSSRLEQP